VLHTVDVRIFDITNRNIIVPYTKTSDKQLVFDVKQLSAGVYYLKIKKDKEYIIRKLIVN
jgi:hypothetical protein